MTPARGTRWRPPAPQHTPDSDSQAEILDLDAEVFAEHIASITVWLPIERGPRHIVDLGCGTGAGAFALLARFPESEVTAVDASAGHLHRLREWAEALGVADRVRTVLADLDADWPELGRPELVWASASDAPHGRPRPHPAQGPRPARARRPVRRRRAGRLPALPARRRSEGAARP